MKSASLRLAPWVLGLALGLALPARAESLTLKGSDSLIVLVQRWAELFMQRNPGVQVQVTGGGTGTGIASLINGTTDIATASRPMTAEERAALQRGGKAPQQVVVAHDAATFYVNDRNPIRALTLEQVRHLYLGDVRSWSGVGGMQHEVSLYSRDSSSGTYAFVKERLLGGQDFAVEAQMLPGTAEVVNAVAQEVWSLGYGGASSARGVRSLPLRLDNGEDVAPTDENIQSGLYPFRRDLYLYTRGGATGTVAAFVAFTLSPEGQDCVRKLGAYPARSR